MTRLLAVLWLLGVLAALCLLCAGLHQLDRRLDHRSGADPDDDPPAPGLTPAETAAWTALTAQLTNPGRTDA